MNLRELKAVTYGLLNDPSQQKINFGSIITYLNMAQTMLGNLMWNVDRDKFLAIDTANAVNGTADYNTPLDLREIVSVTLSGYECQRIPFRDLNALKLATYRPVYPTQLFYSEFEGNAPGKTRIRIFPTPATGAGAGTSNLIIYYYRRPSNFHELGTYEGAATGVGGTATIIDTAAPFNTTATTYTDFWKYAQIRFTSGSNNGIYRRVASQALGSSTITFEPAVVTATTTADTYEMDQMSILPEYIHHMMAYYAAALAAPKAQMDPAPFWGYWNAEMEQMRVRLVSNVDSNIPGEVSMGSQTRAKL